jgi:hypothetical protein
MLNDNLMDNFLKVILGISILFVGGLILFDNCCRQSSLSPLPSRDSCTLICSSGIF